MHFLLFYHMRLAQNHRSFNIHFTSEFRLQEIMGKGWKLMPFGSKSNPKSIQNVASDTNAIPRSFMQYQYDFAEHKEGLCNTRKPVWNTQKLLRNTKYCNLYGIPSSCVGIPRRFITMNRLRNIKRLLWNSKKHLLLNTKRIYGIP